MIKKIREWNAGETMVSGSAPGDVLDILEDMVMSTAEGVAPENTVVIEVQVKVVYSVRKDFKEFSQKVS